jgi:hypothetical protein
MQLDGILEHEGCCCFFSAKVAYMLFFIQRESALSQPRTHVAKMMMSYHGSGFIAKYSHFDKKSAMVIEKNAVLYTLCIL